MYIYQVNVIQRHSTSFNVIQRHSTSFNVIVRFPIIPLQVLKCLRNYLLKVMTHTLGVWLRNINLFPTDPICLNLKYQIGKISF